MGERDAQRTRISFSESRCPSSSFLNLVYETAIGCGHSTTFVNVGANKGYVVSEIVSIFAPHAHVGPVRLGAALHAYGLSLSNYTGCGVCEDCRSDPEPSSASLCNTPRAQLSIHAFEPVPETVLLLQSVLLPLLSGVEGVTFTLHAAAVVRDAESVTSVPFEVCTRGAEVCSIKPVSGGSTVNVPTASLDRWAASDLKNNESIDLLLIDAEGYDPDVLRGAHALLNSARVRILMFEYNSGNQWETESLESMISVLDWHGYTCFLIGRTTSVVLLTGCFEPSSMEMRAWSNILCVRRNEVRTIEALMALTALGSRRGSDEDLHQYR